MKSFDPSHLLRSSKVGVAWPLTAEHWFTGSKETSSASLLPFMLGAKQELPRSSDFDLLTYFRYKMRASLFAAES
ncbi:hypothetical protein MHYP_G00277810 [Metynnis hypsauchen]